jgi:ABC-type uncharacterized transport system permease subunit
MCHTKLRIVLLCLVSLTSLGASAQTHARDVNQRDLQGISSHHYKYILSVVGGTAVGAGLGYYCRAKRRRLNSL